MLDTRARKMVDPLFERIATLLLKLRFTPNLVTALAFLIGICAGVLLYLRTAGRGGWHDGAAQRQEQSVRRRAGCYT